LQQYIEQVLVHGTLALPSGRSGGGDEGGGGEGGALGG
jgi:hypothetical protein